MTIRLIYAASDNGVIGRDNRLPWDVPEDLARFKALTSGDHVLMGRKTWESLPKKVRPLPSRINMVLTSDAAYDAPGAIVCTSLEAVLAEWATRSDRLWIIGGAQLYQSAIANAECIYRTIVHMTVEGDAYEPAIPGNFKLLNAARHTSETGVEYTNQTWKI